MIRRAKKFLSAPIIRMIRSAVRQELVARSTDIDIALAGRMADEAAAFIDGNMGNATRHSTKVDLLRTSLAAVNPALGGIYCEFGVFEGRTLNFIASQVNGIVHGFDSFEGLPEDWRAGVPKGTFKTGRLPTVRENVRLHQGWFEETVPRFARETSGPIAFMHVDADLYSSTKTIFKELGSRIVPGTVIQFDEFFNYRGWQNGEWRAFRELCESLQLTATYLGYTSNAPAQVAVIMNERNSPEAPS